MITPRPNAAAIAALAATLALAPAANALPLLAIGGSQGFLYRINPDTGNTSLIVDTDSIFPRGLAWNTFDQTLHTIGFSKQLLTIDTNTGDVTAAPLLPVDTISALAFDPSRNQFYAHDINDDRLYTIDPETGFASFVANLFDFDGISSLTYDPDLDTLFATEIFSDQLLSIDPDTGAVTVVGQTGFFSIESLALDPVSGKLFGIDNAADQLVSIDKLTAQTTAIAPVSTNIQGLTFIPSPASATLLALAGVAASRRRR